MVPEPEIRSPSVLLRPEKCLEPRNGSWASQAEFGTASIQQSRAVQPNSHPAASAWLSLSRGVQLREVICYDTEYLSLRLVQYRTASYCLLSVSCLFGNRVTMCRLLLALSSQSSCFSLLSAGDIGLGHHPWLKGIFLKLKVKHQHSSLV